MIVLLLPTRPKKARGGSHDFRFFFAGRPAEGQCDGRTGQRRVRAADIQSAAELLPAVYEELRRLAAALTGRLPPGQTLQPTALVHEAYLRLVGDRDPAGTGAATSSVPRRGRCGRSSSNRRAQGGPQARRRGRRVELAEGMAFIEPPADDLLAVDEAIQKLQAEKPHLAEIVMLRYFTGLSVEETAAVLGGSASTLARVAIRTRLARSPLGRVRGGGRTADE